MTNHSCNDVNARRVRDVDEITIDTVIYEKIINHFANLMYPDLCLVKTQLNIVC